MLPTWATVLIALGGSGVGALAGITGTYLGFRGTALTVRSQIGEAWRERLIDVSRTFIERYTDIVIMLQDQIYEEDTPSLSAEDRRALDEAWNEMLKAHIDIALLFGPRNAASAAADKAVDGITQAVKAVLDRAEEGSDVWQISRSELVGGRDARTAEYDAFVAACHAAIEPRLRL